VNVILVEDGERTKYDPDSNSDGRVQVASALERAVEINGIAFSFQCNKDDTTSIEMTLSEGNFIVLPLRAK
jgi:hypothetical protein